MVEWKKLGDVCAFKRGRTITAKEAVEGSVPVIAGGQTPSYYHNEANRTGESITIAGSGAYAGFVAYWNQPIFVSDAFTMDPDKSLLHKYLFQWLKMNQQRIFETQKGAGVPHVHGKDIAGFIIPIPSLSEQTRIVEILDTFSAAIENPKQQIAERKNQYEYYRNNLFEFKEGECEWKKLGEICTQFNGLSGASNKWKDIGNCRFIDYMNAYKNISIDVTNLPYATVQNIEKQIELRKGDVLFTAASETPDECALSAAIESDLPKGVFMDDHLFGIRINDDSKENVLPGYLKYLFRSSGIRSEINKSVRGVTRFYISKKDFMSLSIPIPPMEIQSRIASILDTFEAAIANLEAQLKEREKQYEYYRNKLLTFE